MKWTDRCLSRSVPSAWCADVCGCLWLRCVCQEVSADFRLVTEHNWRVFASLARCVLRSASCCLSKTVDTSQANKVHPGTLPGGSEPGREDVRTFLSDLQQKKLIQQVSFHISPPRLDLSFWTNLMFTSRPLEGLGWEVNNTLRISHSVSFDSPECTFPGYSVFYTDLHTRHLLTKWKLMDVIFHTIESINGNLNLRITGVIMVIQKRVKMKNCRHYFV